MDANPQQERQAPQPVGPYVVGTTCLLIAIFGLVMHFRTSGVASAQEDPQRAARLAQAAQEADDTVSEADETALLDEIEEDALPLADDRLDGGRVGGPPPPKPPRTEPVDYVIKPGDFLGKIAARFDCSVAELQVANGLKDDLIYAGDTLHVPLCTRETAVVAEAKAPRPPVPNGLSWRKGGVDTKTLPRLMHARGFRPPKGFRAFVLEVTFDDTRQRIVSERAFDWQGTSSEVHGWNPASTVKLFAAIGALQRVQEEGFTARAKVGFNGRYHYVTTVAQLVDDAIVKSDNIAYDRLVQLAGFDRLNGQLLTVRNGLGSTAIMEAYAKRAWTKLGESESLRAAPAITLAEGERRRTLPASNGRVQKDCYGSACTNLQNLAEAMRRLMLQEQLSEDDHFGLTDANLKILRLAMRAERARGAEMVDAMASVLEGPGVRFYAKPGYASEWFTDNVYIFDPSSRKAWIVTLAGYPGRHALDGAARTIARIIKDGALE